MRKDMKHVIIDRPRVGGDGGKSIPPKGSKKRFQKIPLEDQPKYQSSARRRVYGYDCKQLNENLSPLRRWLHSQVGRNWDEVWSEICEGLSVRNATTAHVRDHADHYVVKNCIIDEDGTIRDSRGVTLSGSSRWKPFYVDPRDNTLRVICNNPEWCGSRRKKDWVEGKDENHRYYLLKGVWYEVELEPFPHAGVHHRVHDLVIAAKWNDEKHHYTGSLKQSCQTHYGRAVYARHKTQLGKSDIRKLRLWESEMGREYKEAA